MNQLLRFRDVGLVIVLSLCLNLPLGMSQPSQPPEERPLPSTPLTQEILALLANEISGQVGYNNEVALAGAPWMREPKEFTDTFYESKMIHELVRGYGIETTELQRLGREGEFQYPRKATV
jgi:hypothetical protein